MIEDVRRSLETFVKHQHSSDQALCDALVDAGHSLVMAETMTAFIPFAFGRALIIPMGVKCPPIYKCKRSDGRFEFRQFASQPVFNAAAEIAASGVDRDTLLAVAGRSAEFRVINQMFNDGSRAEDIFLVEPLVMWPVADDAAERVRAAITGSEQ